MKTFIPFHQIKNYDPKDVVIVDALHPHCLTLSHWKGANIYEKIQADTSAEICVNAVLKDFKNWDAPFISANHFDIDGFIGVMALMLPEEVKHNPELFVEMGEIGDFRHFNPKSSISHEALKLCIWINETEKKQFYVPFGEKNEIQACIQKFEFFIKSFPKVLQNIDLYNPVWQAQYELVLNGLDQITSKHSIDDIRLQIVKCNEAVPYYALFSETEKVDLVLSIYPNNRYELEYKYTSWVDIVNQVTFPRIDLRPLAALLNLKEKSNYQWRVDRITDTGPILRLEDRKISKANRFADPTERTIYSSSTIESDFVDICCSFLREKLTSIQPKQFWTWEEMKSINQ